MRKFEDFAKEVEASERRAASSPDALAAEIEALRERYGAGDHAWVNIVDLNIDTVLKALRSASSL